MHITTFLLASLALLTRAVSGFSPDASTNMAIYWGQASAQHQDSLASYCTSDSVDIVILSFMYVFPGSNGVPQLNFANACWETFDNGLLHCSQIAQDIQTCQSSGKKILLSMGGASGAYSFTDDQQAADFADTVWDLFFEGSSDTRPFDDAIIDGIDLDIENNNQVGYVAFVKRLRELMGQSSRQYYVGAAPQCVYPDASLQDALQNADLDFVFVQFYNNPCSLTGTEYNWNVWSNYAKTVALNSNTKIYLGLPAAPSAAGSGYVDASVVAKAVADIGSDSSFGGIMLWDFSQAVDNVNSNGVDYATQMKQILLNNAGSDTSSASTSVAPVSSASTSESLVASTSASTSQIPSTSASATSVWTSETSESTEESTSVLPSSTSVESSSTTLWWTAETSSEVSSSSSAESSAESSASASSSSVSTTLWWTPEVSTTSATSTSATDTETGILETASSDTSETSTGVLKVESMTTPLWETSDTTTTSSSVETLESSTISEEETTWDTSKTSTASETSQSSEPSTIETSETLIPSETSTLSDSPTSDGSISSVYTSVTSTAFFTSTFVPGSSETVETDYPPSSDPTSSAVVTKTSTNVVTTTTETEVPVFSNTASDLVQTATVIVTSEGAVVTSTVIVTIGINTDAPATTSLTATTVQTEIAKETSYSEVSSEVSSEHPGAPALPTGTSSLPTTLQTVTRSEQQSSDGISDTAIEGGKPSSSIDPPPSTTQAAPETTETGYALDCSGASGAALASCLNTNFERGHFLGQGEECVSGQIACNALGDFALCNFGSWVIFQCPAGTECYAYVDPTENAFIGCNFIRN